MSKGWQLKALEKIFFKSWSIISWNIIMYVHPEDI